MTPAVSREITPQALAASLGIHTPTEEIGRAHV